MHAIFWHWIGFDEVTVPIRTQDVTIRSLAESLSGVLYLPEQEGLSSAMIVCHGAGEFKENYRELCESLATRGVVALAIDMHGHGASGGERFHVDMNQWVPDVRAAVEFLSSHPNVAPGRIGAFGLSSGGTAILEAALVEPRLKALVALDATVRNIMPRLLALSFKALNLLGGIKRWITKKDLRLSLLKMLEGVRMASDPEVERALRANPRSVEAFKAFPLPGAAHSFFVDTLQKVSRITSPTLVLWGEDDQLDPPETARLLYNALMCKKQLHIIPGNGHVGHLDRNRGRVFSLTADWAIENLA